jgi:drug/metabolite transporter (DMT)-like permease
MKQFYIVIDENFTGASRLAAASMENVTLLSPISAPAHLRQSVKSWAFIVVPGCIWGSSYLFIAEGLKVMRPEGITFVRTVIGFGVLSCIPGVRKPVAHSDRGRVVLLGLIWLALPMSLFPFAEQRVSSALTGLLNGATPLFVAVVSAAQVRKAPSRDAQTALAIGLIGAVLIAVPSLGQGRSSTIGVALVLCALVFYGFAINLARPLQQRNGALPVIWRAVGVAALLTAPTGLHAAATARWSLPAVLSMLALGGLGTGIANVMVATAAGTTSAARASSMGFIIPAVSLSLGVIVRHETVGTLSLLGASVCVSGAILLARSGGQRRRLSGGGPPIERPN